MKWKMLLFATCLCISFVSLSQANERNPDWAIPLFSDRVDNLYRVTALFYRSAQPSAKGMKELEKIGIVTVINLRNFHNDSDEIRGTRLKEIRIPMNTWECKEDDVIKALQVLSNPEGAPYLLHCQHGADRTGLVTAMYRIVIQGWSKEEAIDELTKGGYGYHSIWRNIIRFIHKADIKRIKGAVLTGKPSGDTPL